MRPCGSFFQKFPVDTLNCPFKCCTCSDTLHTGFFVLVQWSIIGIRQWPIGYFVGLRIKRSSVRIRPWPLRWVLGQGSLLPLSQGEAFTLASISYLAILVKYIGKKKKIGCSWNLLTNGLLRESRPCVMQTWPHLSHLNLDGHFSFSVLNFRGQIDDDVVLMDEGGPSTTDVKLGMFFFTHHFIITVEIELLKRKYIHKVKLSCKWSTSWSLA